MFKSRRLRWGALLLVVASLSLFFIGRERALWRPQLIGQDGLKRVEAYKQREATRSKTQIDAVRQRFGAKRFDIWAVSPDGKWMACNYRKVTSFYDCFIEIRDAHTGQLKSKLGIDNPISHRLESAAFSPSGKYLVVNFGYDDIQAAYDVGTGQRTWILPVTQVLFPLDEKCVVRVRIVPSRHGPRPAFIWTSHPQTGRTIRQIPVPSKRIALPVWLDGANHVAFSDIDGNLWRVRFR